MAKAVLSWEDYPEKFQPAKYLKRYCGDSPYFKTLDLYHQAFQSLPTGLRILDYGTGPAILTTISAATKASEIVLSDYSEVCRIALYQWLAGDSEAFDWSPYFSYVVKELEGNGEGNGDEEVAKRQTLVRNLVKAVVKCDLTQNSPIEPGYEQPYDVVISSLCIEAVIKSKDEYQPMLEKLVSLVKPGGHLLLYGVESQGGSGYYVVGDETFSSVGRSLKFALHAMAECCMEIITTKYFKDVQEVEEDPKVASFYFIHGEKGKKTFNV